MGVMIQWSRTLYDIFTTPSASTAAATVVRLGHRIGLPTSLMLPFNFLLINPLIVEMFPLEIKLDDLGSFHWHMLNLITPVPKGSDNTSISHQMLGPTQIK